MILNRDDDWSMANGRCGRKDGHLRPECRPAAVDYGLAGAIRRGPSNWWPWPTCSCPACTTPPTPWPPWPVRGGRRRSDRLVEPLKPSRAAHRVETVAEIGAAFYVDDSKGHQRRRHPGRHRRPGPQGRHRPRRRRQRPGFFAAQAALEKHGRRRPGSAATPPPSAAIARRRRPLASSAADMATPVRWLAGQAVGGDCVLLSPPAPASTCTATTPIAPPSSSMRSRAVVMMLAPSTPRRQWPKSTRPAVERPAAVFAGLVFVYSASIAIAEGGRSLQPPAPGVFPGPPWRSSLCIGLVAAAVAFQIPSALAEICAPSFGRASSCWPSSHSRHRPRCQWRPPLDLPRALPTSSLPRMKLFAVLYAADFTCKISSCTT